MSILWTIIIGFLAGVIARFFHPGNKYEPKGFILTTLLGIVGAFVATYLGQAIGWYQAGEGAGFIGGGDRASSRADIRRSVISHLTQHLAASSSVSVALRLTAKSKCHALQQLMPRSGQVLPNFR
jgi:uncharacterized membrane protein YeaQ/YmgE (transglycosylase-associated protein family)